MQKREADVLAALIPSDIRAQLFHLPPELGNELLRAPFPIAITLTLCHTQNDTAKSPNTALGTAAGKFEDSYRQDIGLCYETQLRCNITW